MRTRINGLTRALRSGDQSCCTRVKTVTNLISLVYDVRYRWTYTVSLAVLRKGLASHLIFSNSSNRLISADATGKSHLRAVYAYTRKLALSFMQQAFMDTRLYDTWLGCVLSSRLSRIYRQNLRDDLSLSSLLIDQLGRSRSGPAKIYGRKISSRALCSYCETRRNEISADERNHVSHNVIIFVVKFDPFFFVF